MFALGRKSFILAQVRLLVTILTVSDGVKGPLVILEERVSLDFLHTVSAQSHLPQNKERESELHSNDLI